MGCSPVGKLISMALGGRGRRPSRKRSRRERRREYSPQPQHFASQSMLRTVIYRDDAPVVHVAQPVHTIQPPTTVQVPDRNQQLQPPLPEAHIRPSPQAGATAEEKGGEEQVVYAVRGDAGYQPGGFPDAQMAAGVPGTGAAYRYAPSPVPSGAWGEQGDPRGREYFGGEYRYSYPTPMREGIYRMATDANRLTTMFSDENPNACSIA